MFELHPVAGTQLLDGKQDPKIVPDVLNVQSGSVHLKAFQLLVSKRARWDCFFFEIRTAVCCWYVVADKMFTRG